MELSDRIKTILVENKLKQKDFAKSINVTESYISKLLRSESGLSRSTAALIEELYGYSADWILEGKEPKLKLPNRETGLTLIQKKIIADIEQMDKAELIAVRAFIHSLGEYQKNME